MNQLFRLQHALVAAVKVAEKISVANLIAKCQRNEALELLISANCRLENGNRGGRSVNDIGTRALFPVHLDKDTGLKLGKIFNEYPNLKTLGGLVKVSFAEVEMTFENSGILCPLALRFFSACYEAKQRKIEHAAEPTKPALLEA